MKTVEQLNQENLKLKEMLRVAANQLEGVSLAIQAHGQNINTDFFIETYKKFAEDIREEIKNKGF